MMQQQDKRDVIISGAGMVGLALAIAAHKAGLSVTLIEQGKAVIAVDEADVFSPRVSALNLASEHLLRNLGAWDLIPTHRKTPYRDMRVWDGLGQGEIHFDANSVQKPHLGHIVENNFICDALWQVAYAAPGIDILTEDSIQHWQQDGNLVHVETQQGAILQGSVLVGSEGKQSPVRKLANIDLWQWDYHHTAIVTTVRHTKPHQQCAHQVFLESGPLAFLPLTSGSAHVSSIVWSAKTEEADRLMTLDDTAFMAALSNRTEGRLGDMTQIDSRFAFPLTAQQAKTYRDGRVVIVGDAAHTIHPLAGLGVNLGFLDAAVLADVWQRAKQKKTDIGHEFTLRRFQRQRQAHNLAVGGLMEGLKRLFDTQMALPVILRNTGLKWVDQSALLKRPLVMGALGEAGVYLPPLCRSNPEQPL